MDKLPVLGVGISSVTMDEAVGRVLNAARSGSSFAGTALAVHGVMTGVLDAEQRFRLNALDLVTPDGQPVRWALNWLHGAGLRQRVYGPDLTLALCAAAARERLPVYFYGSTEAALADLRAGLLARFPDLIIAGTQPSQFRRLSDAETAAAAAAIRDSGARLVFVGLGCPRQETWAYEMHSLLPLPIMAVGAAFDFLGRRKAQAPQWMQDRGLEWLFRLLREPGRLWRRYLLLNPAYVTLLIRQRLTRWGWTLGGREPHAPQRFG